MCKSELRGSKRRTWTKDSIAESATSSQSNRWQPQFGLKKDSMVRWARLSSNSKPTTVESYQPVSMVAPNRTLHKTLTVWADFELKAQDTTLYFPEEFTHEIEQAWNHLDSLGKLGGFGKFPDYRRKSMRNFSQGFVKFAKTPSLDPVSMAPQSFQIYARTAPFSRLRHVQDGFDYWQIIGLPPRVPSPTQKVGNWPIPSTIPIHTARRFHVCRTFARGAQEYWQCPTLEASGSTPLRY
jgi:hypothetical protein